LKISSFLRAHASEMATPDPWILLDTDGHVIYWRSRESDDLWCGVGQAYADPLLSTCLHVLESVECDEELPFAPRCFGITGFHPFGPIAPEWQGFPLQGYWIPRVLIRYRGSQRDMILIDSFRSKDPGIPLRPKYEAVPKNRVVREQSTISSDEWQKAVQKIRSRIQAGALEKAVLARQLELIAEDRIFATDVMKRLAESSPDSYLFAIRYPRSGIFFGASPECLFHLKGKSVSVDSLAGSRPRKNNQRSDRELAEELVVSEKDMKEQRFVTDYILERLAPICSDLKVSDLRVKNLATVQHLYNNITGAVKPSLDHFTATETILSQLHPTPAVCGVPTEAARQLIEALEPDARGLYAGAIGYTDSESAEFAVSIRSGLLLDNRALLFAGAGIVADSVADNEYTECDWKFAGLKQALFPT
jgi:menaquinone-specific isochorismate synthase